MLLIFVITYLPVKEKVSQKHRVLAVGEDLKGPSFSILDSLENKSQAEVQICMIVISMPP